MPRRAHEGKGPYPTTHPVFLGVIAMPQPCRALHRLLWRAAAAEEVAAAQASKLESLSFAPFNDEDVISFPDDVHTKH
jgi:hypothetical protein